MCDVVTVFVYLYTWSVERWQLQGDMSGSGCEENNSSHNQSNATDGLKNLIGSDHYIQVALVIPACIHLSLCTIALAAIARVRVLRVGQNLYIVNMIFSDVLSAIVGLWLFIFALYDYDYGNQRMIPACQTVLFLWHWQFCWSMSMSHEVAT